MVAWPGISIAVAAIFFGAYLLVTGIQQVIFAFSLHVTAGGRVLLFISGAASLILAVLAFRHLYDAVLLMAIWIAVGFVFRGVATTVSAISDPTLPGRGWNIFVGIISLIAGVVVLASPFESMATLALVVGIWLIVIGLMEVVAAFGIRAATRRSTPKPTADVAPEAAGGHRGRRSQGIHQLKLGVTRVMALRSVVYYNSS